MTRRPAPAAFFLSGGEDDTEAAHIHIHVYKEKIRPPIQSPFILLRLKDTMRGRGEKKEVKASSGGFCSRRVKGRKKEGGEKTEAIVFLLSANSQ